MCVCVCVCVCACVRACVRACVVVYECVGVPQSLNRLHERLALSVAWGYDPWTTFKNIFYTSVGRHQDQRNYSEKSAIFFVPFKHILKALFMGIPKVQEQAFSEDRKCTIVVHGW